MKKKFVRRNTAKFLRADDGATAVEFALVMPIFLFVLFGTMEIGNILFAQSTLQQGVETGGRYAMIHVDANVAAIKKAAIANTVKLGALSPTFAVSKSTVDGINYSVISVNAKYTLMTPFLTGQSIQLNAQMSVAQTDPADFS